MKLFAPQYYRDFYCIADRCRHSCCIGWEIDVDTRTMERYRSLASDYGKEIRESIDTTDVDAPHFRLGAQDRCPHLTDRGLCNIILHCGEDCLCDICREHPRFYNDTPIGKEVGVGMACEEACRLILTSDAYADIVEIGDVDGEAEDLCFDVLSARADVFSILSERTMPYLQRLMLMGEQYGVSTNALTDEEWRETLASLEYLDDTHRALFGYYSSTCKPDPALEKPLERAFAYFVYRHCTQALDMDEFAASLGFCMICERLIASIAAAQKIHSLTDLIEIARIVSEEIEYSEENTDAIKGVFYELGFDQ